MSVLTTLQESLKFEQQNLANLIKSLAGKTGAEKRQIKKSIRKTDDRIKDLLKAIKKANDEQTDMILASQGIDSDANKVEAVTSAITSVASDALGVSGVFGDNGIFSGGRADVLRGQAERDRVRRTAPENLTAPVSPDLIKFGVIALGAIVLLKSLGRGR